MQNVNDTPVSRIHINSSFLMMGSTWSYNPSGGRSYEGMGTKCSSVRKSIARKIWKYYHQQVNVMEHMHNIYTFIV